MMLRVAIVGATLVALSACATPAENRAKFDSIARPYSIGNVKFNVKTGSESNYALSLARGMIQRSVDACRKYAPSNKPASDVTLEVFSYHFQPVYGIFVPGRSKLNAYARWDAKGEDSFRFTVRGTDPYQNNLTTVPTGADTKQFFAKRSSDVRLAETFAEGFINRLVPHCGESENYQAWAANQPSAFKTRVQRPGTTRNYEAKSHQSRTTSTQTAGPESTVIAPKVKVYDGTPTPPPVGG